MFTPNISPLPKCSSTTSARYPVSSTMSRSPRRAKESTTRSRYGRPLIGIIGLGSPFVSAPRRVPKPPARMATVTGIRSAPPLHLSRAPKPLERPNGRLPPLQRRRPDPVAILDRNLGDAVAHAERNHEHVHRQRRALRIPRHLFEHRLAIRAHAAVHVRGADAVEQPRGPRENAVGEIVRERHRLRPL